MRAKYTPNQPTGDLIDGTYAWLRLAISAALGIIGSIGFWGVVVILPTVQAEFGVDRGDASMPYTTTMIGFAVGNVLIGRYVDRLGIIIPIIAAALSMGVGFAAAAAAETFGFLRCCRAFLLASERQLVLVH